MSNKKHRVYAYFRVATYEQLSECHQLRLLKDYSGKHHDWELVGIFCAAGYRGTKGCKAGQREILERCMVTGADTLLVPKLTTIDRQAVGLLRFIDQATAHGLTIEVIQGAKPQENETLKAVREVLKWLGQSQ